MTDLGEIMLIKLKYQYAVTCHYFRKVDCRYNLAYLRRAKIIYLIKISECFRQYLVDYRISMRIPILKCPLTNSVQNKRLI